MKTPKKIVFHAWQDEASMRQGRELLPTAAAILSPVVLIIDDSPTVRKIVEVTLQRDGYGQIHSFADGVAALAWLASPQGRIPALILLDIEMPKMSGYEIARCLTQSPALARTHVVMLSRRTGIVDRLKARLAGAENYLAKPFTTTQLLTLVERSIGPAPSQGLESGASSPLPAESPLSPTHERGGQEAFTEQRRVGLVLCPDYQQRGIS